MRWIYFLISRPLLSFKNLRIPGTKHSEKKRYQPVPVLSNLPTDFLEEATSTSWVAFAAPMECVREMGTSKETPFWDIAEEDKGKVEGRKVEFQFSFGGVPCFEFSEKDMIEEGLVLRGVQDEDSANQGEWLVATELEQFGDDK